MSSLTELSSTLRSLCRPLHITGYPPISHSSLASNFDAQQVKAISAKPDNLNLTPRTHMVEVENWLLQVVCAHTPKHTQSKWNKIHLRYQVLLEKTQIYTLIQTHTHLSASVSLTVSLRLSTMMHTPGIRVCVSCSAFHILFLCIPCWPKEQFYDHFHIITAITIIIIKRLCQIWYSELFLVGMYFQNTHSILGSWNT